MIVFLAGETVIYLLQRITCLFYVLRGRKSVFKAFLKRAQAIAKKDTKAAIHFVRYHGLYIASALEVVSCGSVGEVTYPSIKRLVQGQASVTDVGFAATSAALALWLVVGVGGMIPIAAVNKTTNKALSLQEKNRLNQQIKRRNALIFNISAIDMMASAMYAVAGVLLDKKSLIISGASFFFSAFVRCGFRQGERELTRPSVPKGSPLFARAKAHAKYAKDLSVNNPNLPAEILCLPGIYFSCCGLLEMLPKEVAWLAVGGYGLATLVRTFSIARQKELTEDTGNPKRKNNSRPVASAQERAPCGSRLG